MLVWTSTDLLLVDHHQAVTNNTEEANQGLDTYLHTPVVQAETEDQNYHQITLEVVAEDSEAVEEAAVADTEVTRADMGVDITSREEGEDLTVAPHSKDTVAPNSSTITREVRASL